MGLSQHVPVNFQGIIHAPSFGGSKECGKDCLVNKKRVKFVGMGEATIIIPFEIERESKRCFLLFY
jgi:hypothetical protein